MRSSKPAVFPVFSSFCPYLPSSFMPPSPSPSSPAPLPFSMVDGVRRLSPSEGPLASEFLVFTCIRIKSLLFINYLSVAPCAVIAAQMVWCQTVFFYASLNVLCVGMDMCTCVYLCAYRGQRIKGRYWTCVAALHLSFSSPFFLFFPFLLRGRIFQWIWSFSFWLE